jgi:hypothetical protein
MVSWVETNPPFEFLLEVIHLIASNASGNLSCRIRLNVLYAVNSIERAKLPSSEVLRVKRKAWFTQKERKKKRKKERKKEKRKKERKKE